MATHKSNLDRSEAIICWQLKKLGYHQHEIAAVFKVNQRCVHEILREKKHLGSKEAAELVSAS
jgi:plasmid maintenance system antidote protein VapI